MALKSRAGWAGVQQLNKLLIVNVAPRYKLSLVYGGIFLLGGLVGLVLGGRYYSSQVAKEFNAKLPTPL